jgi:hypothetical protein
VKLDFFVFTSVKALLLNLHVGVTGNCVRSPKDANDLVVGDGHEDERKPVESGKTAGDEFVIVEILHG